MSPLKGQKIKDNPKDTRIQIRLDKETIEKLDCLATKQNSDRSKVIRKGVDIQYEKAHVVRLKIKTQKQDEEAGATLYFVSSKQNSEYEKERKQKLLDELCNYIDVEEIGYTSGNGERVVTIKKDGDGLILSIARKFIED